MHPLEDVPVERLSDSELLLEAGSGNHQAFGVFCERVLPGLIRHLVRLCQACAVPKDLSHDFAQEAILKLARLVKKCATEINKSYLHKIATNLVMDWVRENRRSKKATKVLQELMASNPTREEIEEREEVLNFFGWLTPGEREILELILLEGLTIKEAGKRLEISDNAAYKVYERAIFHMRELIQEHGSLAQSVANNIR